MRVFDLASGGGEPSLRDARRVGPQGSVLGPDISEALLGFAREKARHAAILDYGIAKLVENPASPAANDTTQTEQTGYMAPEHINGGTVDARSDMFSFGALLYEMLRASGRLPSRRWPRRSGRSFALQLVAPRQIVSELPEELPQRHPLHVALVLQRVQLRGSAASPGTTRSSAGCRPSPRSCVTARSTASVQRGADALLDRPR